MAMKKTFLFTGGCLLFLALTFTSFRIYNRERSHHKKGPYQIEIQNSSATPGRTITVATVGPYTFTGLSIPPGGFADFGVLTNFSGTITVSVSCSSAWKGTLNYSEDETPIACSTTGTGATHSLSTTASPAVFRLVQITDATYPCP